MTTINETVTTALQNAGLSQYQQNAAPVVTALVNREQGIVGSIIEIAQQSDLDVAGVRTVLANAGLHMPPEAPVATHLDATPVDVQATDLAAVLGRIEQTLTGLTTFARNHGYNG